MPMVQRENRARSASPSPQRLPCTAPLLLPSLIKNSRGTRFANHAASNAPLRESCVSLLLSVCGYRVRRGAELAMSGASGRWMPVPAPRPGQTLVAFLEQVCRSDWPSRAMDAIDERFDVVFAR